MALSLFGQNEAYYMMTHTLNVNAGL